ncbi:hypothetical protein FGADI_3349 [Fusarium gaditjirri]|uniref:Heterokaryon incompatibility domain-containing protein n=1 Tax=Fusarium gaditjirri TaxID=282569 RepID=A0A8H4TFY0_9HYPO|nr:hypothetical protein FGADI_3349 [Fusarium gaditjirri]
MRLIRARILVEAQSISFVEFYGEKPRYAILSHTWESHQEVTYQDSKLELSKLKTGYEKIRKTCELALGDGLEYVWIDTCCIDKSSSAELTEAINSMFLWYQEASVCYVYLVDKFEGSTLGDCRWFTRGWTLQELIAPKSMSFFNNSWDCIGTKNSLMSQLTVITPIDPDILRHNAPISSACIAKRLSWAAGRKTTRVEDMAYCLLGICNINMPMLYGEGKIAFRRLQEEIIRSTYDLSLLAWTPPVSSDVLKEEYCGFLAESVNHFASCSEMYSVTDSLMDEGKISVSNKGLRLMARVFVLDYSDQDYKYVLKLDCMAPGFDGDFLTIPIRKVGPNTFVRAHSRGESDYSFHLESASWGESAFYTVTLLTTMPSLTVRSPLSVARGSDLISYSRFTLVSIELPPDISIIYALETPVKFWDAEDRAFFGPHGSYRNWGAFVLETNTLFICFWHKDDTEWTFKASLLDMSRPEVQNLWKDLFLSAEQLGYQQLIVQYMLINIEDEMESSVETYLRDASAAKFVPARLIGKKIVHGENTMDLLEELEAMAQTATAFQDDYIIPESTIARWQKLFGYSATLAERKITEHRNNPLRFTVSEDHWNVVRDRMEVEGHDHESYEHSCIRTSLDAMNRRQEMTMKERRKLRASVFLIKLEGPLHSVQAVIEATNKSSTASAQVLAATDLSGQPSSFFKINGIDKLVIEGWLRENHYPNFTPTFIKDLHAPKDLSSASLYPTLGLDTTLPQHRLGPDEIPRRAQSEYPVLYFFYGTLADPSVLAKLLGSDFQPRYDTAKILGGVLTKR